MSKHDFLQENCSVAIFGGPGGGSVVAQSVRNLEKAGKPILCIGFLNDTLSPGSQVGDLPVLGAFDSWCDLNDETKFIAPLHKAGTAIYRSKRILDLRISDFRWSNVIDPLAQIGNSSTLGYGIAIAPYTVVQPNVNIGNHVAIRSGVSIGHDTVISNYAFIGSNATLCGYVAVGTGAHISPGAVIRENIRIGNFSVVGLGAVVIDDVPDFSVVAGNPARVIRRLHTDEPQVDITSVASKTTRV